MNRTINKIKEQQNMKRSTDFNAFLLLFHIILNTLQIRTCAQDFLIRTTRMCARFRFFPLLCGLCMKIT